MNDKTGVHNINRAPYRRVRKGDDPMQIMLDDHEKRIGIIEANDASNDEIIRLIHKIIKYIKVGGPIVATAAVSSGIVSGKWGAFFRALLQ